jgi:hypothetical protein
VCGAREEGPRGHHSVFELALRRRREELSGPNRAVIPNRGGAWPDPPAVSTELEATMWETRDVTLTVWLPRDVAEQAEEIQATDPESLRRIVLYGLTRRWVYRYLREKDHA